MQTTAVASVANQHIGVEALIDFVKDDAIVSKAILQSFIDETTDNILLLNEHLANSDEHAASQLSHKLLPLYRMMHNKLVVFLLYRLEREKNLSDQERDELMELLKESVVEATVLVEKLSQD